MQGEKQIYKTDKLTFILLPDKIVFLTSLNLSYGGGYYLLPKSKHWNRRLRLIRTMIQLNEIKDLNELSEWCESGNIAWVPTHQKYIVEKELEAV